MRPWNLSTFDPRIKPSFGAVVNWDHPLSEWLLFSALLNEGGGRTCDAVAFQYSLVGGYTWHGDLRLNGVDAYASSSCVIAVPQRFSVVMDVGQFDGSAGTYRCVVAHQSAAPPTGPRVFVRSRAWEIDCGARFGFASPVTTGIAAEAGVLLMKSRSGETRLLAENGTYLNTSAGTMSGSSPVLIGARNSGSIGLFWAGVIRSVQYFSEFLPDSLRHEPYALFAPRRRVYYGGAAATNYVGAPLNGNMMELAGGIYG